MPAIVAPVAPASALSKDTELGLLEWCWPSSVTSTKPSAATPSRTVCYPAAARIANWHFVPSKDKRAERDTAETNIHVEQTADSPPLLNASDTIASPSPDLTTPP